MANAAIFPFFFVDPAERSGNITALLNFVEEVASGSAAILSRLLGSTALFNFHFPPLTDGHTQVR